MISAAAGKLVVNSRTNRYFFIRNSFEIDGPLRAYEPPVPGMNRLHNV
jgi:hypothetical protein